MPATVLAWEALGRVSGPEREAPLPGWCAPTPEALSRLQRLCGCEFRGSAPPRLILFWTTVLNAPRREDTLSTQEVWNGLLDLAHGLGSESTREALSTFQTGSARRVTRWLPPDSVVPGKDVSAKHCLSSAVPIAGRYGVEACTAPLRTTALTTDQAWVPALSIFRLLLSTAEIMEGGGWTMWERTPAVFAVEDTLMLPPGKTLHLSLAPHTRDDSPVWTISSLQARPGKRRPSERVLRARIYGPMPSFDTGSDSDADPPPNAGRNDGWATGRNE
jgi:hypothetical protein